MDHPPLNDSYTSEIANYLQDFEIDVKDIRTALKLAKDELERQYHWISVNTFSQSSAEIHFFKILKSAPFSHFIYFMTIRDFKSEWPTIGQKQQLKFVERKIIELNAFFNRNRDFIAYTEQECTHLDDIYYTRSYAVKNSQYRLYFLDPGFSTSHDTLLAKYYAMVRFRDFLGFQIKSLLNGQKIKEQNLKWTGAKVDLVELIYALYASGVFNHGNASLKRIAESLSKEFSCPLGDFYRSYSELRYRKKSRTKFLNHLSSQLLEKMDRDDC